MSEFDVSIVIPTYNRPQLITKALDSIEAQETNYSYEVIVQDNSSNELTKKLLEENSHKYTFKLFYEKNNEVLTPILNWKRAIERSSSENIKILWDDDWLEPNALQVYLTTLFENNADVVISAAYLLSNKIKYKAYKTNEKNLTSSNVVNSITELGKRLPLTPSCSVVKKDLILKAFEINSDLIKCNEKAMGLDFVINYIGCFINGYKVIKINNFLVNLYRSKDSITVNSNKFTLLGCYVSSAYNLAKYYNFNFTSKQIKNIQTLSYLLNKLNLRCINYLPDPKFNFTYIVLLFKNRISQRLSMFLSVWLPKN